MADKPARAVDDQWFALRRQTDDGSYLMTFVGAPDQLRAEVPLTEAQAQAVIHAMVDVRAACVDELTLSGPGVPRRVRVRVKVARVGVLVSVEEADGSVIAAHPMPRPPKQRR